MNSIEALKNKYLKLTSNTVLNYDKFSQYAIVYHSNAIEGSTLTKEETYLLLDEQLTPQSKPLEHTMMAVDHLNALKYTLQLANEKKKLTVEEIHKIAALVMKNTGSKISSMAGDFDSSI